MRIQIFMAIALIGAIPTLSIAQSCTIAPITGRVWTHNNAVLFTTPVLNVDADGAPDSYLVDGNGLSYTCDGVVAIEDGRRITAKTNPKDWQRKCNAAWTKAKSSNDYSGVAIFGFQTDNKNIPLIQGSGDPLPGKAYISATSAVIPGMPKGTQRQYVDATKIPYIVLPSTFVGKYKVKPGSLAVVFRKKTGRYAFAVFADIGGLGEASVKLHQDLGNEPIQKISGVGRAKARIEDETLTAVFPNKVAGPVADAEVWNAIIKKEGSEALSAFGGLEMLQACTN
jgi:hypothetical protein